MATATKNPGYVVNLGEAKKEADSPLKIAVRRFFKHRMAVTGLFLLAFIFLYITVGTLFFSESYANSPSSVRTDYFQAPSERFILGTDQVGRDVLARTIYGGQISLMIAVTSITIAISLGTLIGLVSGYTVGTRYSWIDAILMRIVEALLSFPTLILLLILSQSFARSTATINLLGRELSATVLAIVAVIGLTGWMGLSRIVRSLVLSLKEQEFVVSARALGASDIRIIFAHILPNCIAPIVVSATLGIGGAILTEAYLSFLGFGVQQPTATWGNILERARDDIDRYWWLWMAPGFLITMTVLAINFIGDGLRDALDPRSTK
ncbi:MAG: ABC transporter permease [Anaerolineae bacterium]|jgi:peptide/nickel transport system permease protein|nr:ABC transporter permease [Anaerolineae bacterium]